MALQLVLVDPGRTRLVAGLPSALRSLLAAGRDLAPARVLLSSPDPGALLAYGRQLRRLGSSPRVMEDGSLDDLASGEPVLVLSGEGFASPEALGRFVDYAAALGGPARWVHGGRTVASYRPRAGALGRRRPELLDGPAAAEGTAWEAAPGDWNDARGEAAARAAEDSLWRALPQATDGFIARQDRRLSMALSRLLLPTPATPNMITTASLALGLAGAWLLARGPYALEALGALMLWSCCILDGSDGEIARLKLLASRAGGLYDVVADNVVHAAIFVAVPLNIQRKNPDASFLIPGIVLVTGFLACMFSVWWLVLRRPAAERGPAGLLVERLASRDFIYLILALTLLGRLEWFLWAAGAGSHLFNLGLWLALPRRPSP